MRHCVFIADSHTDLSCLAPIARHALSSGLRLTVMYSGAPQRAIEKYIDRHDLEVEIVQAGRRRGRAGVIHKLTRVPVTLYTCTQRIAAIKTWTRKRPLVLVRGSTLSTWLAAVAGRWGGGDIVYTVDYDSDQARSATMSKRLIRRLTARKAKFALCSNDIAAAHMTAYPGCIVANVSDSPSGSTEQTVQRSAEALLNWSGVRS